VGKGAERGIGGNKGAAVTTAGIGTTEEFLTRLCGGGRAGIGGFSIARHRVLGSFLLIGFMLIDPASLPSTRTLFTTFNWVFLSAEAAPSFCAQNWGWPSLQDLCKGPSPRKSNGRFSKIGESPQRVFCLRLDTLSLGLVDSQSRAPLRSKALGIQNNAS
jgi:hypothetical protein